MKQKGLHTPNFCERTYFFRIILHPSLHAHSNVWFTTKRRCANCNVPLYKVLYRTQRSDGLLCNVLQLLNMNSKLVPSNKQGPVLFRILPKILLCKAGKLLSYTLAPYRVQLRTTYCYFIVNVQDTRRHWRFVWNYPVDVCLISYHSYKAQINRTVTWIITLLQSIYLPDREFFIARIGKGDLTLT
jgi:hypothetical protein